MPNESGEERKIRAKNKKWPRNIFVVLLLSVVLGIAFAVTRLQSFQNCVCDSQRDYRQNNPQQKPAAVIIYPSCYSGFLEAHNGTVSAISGLLIAIFTGTLWWATKRLQDASAEQSDSMQDSIAQSARAAKAMEEVAQHFADNVATVRERSAQQARAYVFTVIHQGMYQEREKGFKFAARPAIVNTGHTPAYKILHKTRAAILPIPLPENFSFPLPDKFVGGASLGPQQHFILTAIVDDFCDDADIFAIKTGSERALYVWGIVSYDDAFGQNQSTKFARF